MCTFCVFYCLVVRMINFGFYIVSVLFCFFENWCEEFVGILWANLNHFARAVFEALPLLFGLGFNMCGFSLLNFRIQVISCLFDSSLQVISDWSEHIIEKFARSCYRLFYIVRIIYLFFSKVRIVFLYCTFDARLLNCLSIIKQFSSIGYNFLKVVDCGWVSKQWYGA
jgi:hypothetical protein